MNQHISILYLATTIHDKKIIAGGMHTHTQGVLLGFWQLGIPVIYASADSLLQESITKNGTQNYLLHIPWPFSTLPWKFQCFLSNIFFTWQALKLDFSSITHIYQRYTILNCTGIIISKIKKIPCIIEYNGSEVWVLKHWSPKRWLSFIWLVRMIERFILKRATYITVVSQVLKDDLIEQGITKSKILVNPNGVDEYVYQPTSLKQQKNIPAPTSLNHKTVFGFIGTFNTWHGINIIFQIIKTLKEKPIHFILIGDGPLRSSFIKELEDANLTHLVTLPGMLPKAQAVHYLLTCDIFLCPTQKNRDGSRFFGSPTKLFEYMSLAKPIIASDLEQLTDIINPAITCANMHTLSAETTALGLLADPDKAEEFSALAHLLLNLDKNIHVRIGNNARRRVVKKYTWKQHVYNIMKFAQEKSLGITCSVDI